MSFQSNPFLHYIFLDNSFKLYEKKNVFKLIYYTCLREGRDPTNPVQKDLGRDMETVTMDTIITEMYFLIATTVELCLKLTGYVSVVYRDNI